MPGALPEPLVSSVGQPIQRIRRILYVFQGRPRTDFGLFELTVGGRTFLFDNATDGDSLRVDERAWTDPFSEPLSEENRTFVASFGKWTAFDVSTEAPWGSFVGVNFGGAELLVDEAGKYTGVILRADKGGAVRLGVMADDLFIDEIVMPD